MHFVSFPSGQSGDPVLVSPTEDDIAAYGMSAHDSPANDPAAIWKVAYGSFVPQLGVPPLTRAKHLLRCQGAMFGGFTRTNAHSFAEVHRIHLFDMYVSQSGRRIYFPCCVLLRTALEIPPHKSRGPLFLHPCQIAEARARNAVPFSDPLGILGVKSEMLKARPALAENPDRSDWLRFASEEYARKIAWEIR
jgi:hypothetical protein